MLNLIVVAIALVSLTEARVADVAGAGGVDVTAVAGAGVLEVDADRADVAGVDVAGVDGLLCPLGVPGCYGK